MSVCVLCARSMKLTYNGETVLSGSLHFNIPSNEYISTLVLESTPKSCGSRGSSVSIVPDHRLDDRAIEVRFPAETEDSSCSLCDQTGSGLTQTPVQWAPGVLSPGLKRARGMTLTTHPHLVPRS
jgi:hypothetical protein